MGKMWTLAALAVCAGAAGTAAAAVNVTTDVGTIVQNTFDPVTAKWTIVLRSTSSSQPTTFDIIATTNDRIAYVGVEAHNVGQATILNLKGLNDLPRLQSVDVIERVQPTSNDVWVNELRTIGNVGSIAATSIVDAQIGHNLTGTVELLVRANGGESSLMSMNVAGDVKGDIYCPFGSIFNLTVGGKIGAPEDPSIIKVRNRIENLVAGDIYADISTVDYFPMGFTGHLEATTANGGTGVFSGRLVTNTFFSSPNPGLFVDGVFDADVIINGSLNVPGSQIVIPPGGLTRQVYINAGNTGGAWNQPFKVGFDGDPAQLTLSNASYPTLSSELGGGAVGKAPFRLHWTDCFPVYGATAPSSGGELAAPVRARHYGPVTWMAGSAPMIVEQRPDGSSGSWQDISSRFDFASANDSRDVLISKRAGLVTGFGAGMEFRLRPVRNGPGALRCMNVTGAPLVANTDAMHVGYEYFFAVGTNCGNDLDGDGTVSSADLAILLGSWGACAGPCPADLNNDSVVGASDLAMLLGAWGPC